MIKRIGIIKLLILLFLILGSALFIFTQAKQKAVIRNTISDKARQFIKKQQSNAQSQLRNVDLLGPQGEDTRNKRIGRPDCYSFVIPYRVTIAKIEDLEGSECYARFTFDKPKGAIVAYKWTKEIKSWEEIPAVEQRRRQTDEYYPQEEKTLGGKTFLMFKTREQVYEKNVFYYTSSYFFVFNLLTKTNDNLDSDLNKMLSTLEIE